MRYNKVNLKRRKISLFQIVGLRIIKRIKRISDKEIILKKAYIRDIKYRI